MLRVWRIFTLHLVHLCQQLVYEDFTSTWLVQVSTVPFRKSSFHVPWAETDSSGSDDELVILYAVSERLDWVRGINRRLHRFCEYYGVRRYISNLLQAING